MNEFENISKRKRKSRWGDKDPSVPPPMILNNATALPGPVGLMTQNPSTGKVSFPFSSGP